VATHVKGRQHGHRRPRRCSDNEGYRALDERSVSSEQGLLEPRGSSNSPTERSRIVCVFDADYAAHGSVVYSAARLLIHQIGDAVSYDVFCSGAYRGPTFRGKVRVTEGQKAHALPGRVRRVVQRVRRLAVRLGINESADRWTSNLIQGEAKLLPRLFDADHIQAVIVFTTDPAFALRIVRLAHIYSTTETPHLIVVTPGDRMDARTAADLDWLGTRLLRDGDLVVERNRTAVPSGRDEPAVKVTAPVFSFLAPEEYPRQLANPRTPVAWPAWIGAGRPYPKRVRDVVLFVRPDWTNCGSGTTFENLARWFRERDSLLIDVGIWPFGENFDPIDRVARVGSEQDNIRAALYFAVRRSTSLLHVMRQAGMLLRWFPRSVARQKMLQYSLAAQPRIIRQAIRHARISHIYLNHYFTYGYVRDFIADRPFFLDTHDIQTVNFIHHNQRNAITRRADRFATSLRDEMEISRMAQRLGFVSQQELDLAALYVDRSRLDYVLPLPRVVACPPRPPGSPARLLIVSSDNLANVQSLNWFFAHVWPMVLQLSEGQALPTLRICGGIDAAMAHVDLPGVAFMGVVPELRTYYDEADLVLLPVITGGGVAIKTLEAVLHERPVLATRHALRGLPDDAVRTIGHEDDPTRYAKSLLAVISDKERHQAQVDRARQAAALLRGYSFYRTLGTAVDAVRLSGP
jgi:hypothetical protein